MITKKHSGGVRAGGGKIERSPQAFGVELPATSRILQQASAAVLRLLPRTLRGCACPLRPSPLLLLRMLLLGKPLHGAEHTGHWRPVLTPQTLGVQCVELRVLSCAALVPCQPPPGAVLQ